VAELIELDERFVVNDYGLTELISLCKASILNQQLWTNKKIIKLFYKKMSQLKIFRACFDQSFFQNTLFSFTIYQGY